MLNKITSFIKKQLEKKAPLPPDEELPSYRYLDRGHVDSIGLVKFIFEIEDEFAIEFSPEETQSDEFRTIGGLITMINRKILDSATNE